MLTFPITDDVANLLTYNADAGGHSETILTIDWSDTSLEQIRLLARAHIIYRVQMSYRFGGKIPEYLSVRVTDMIHLDPIGEQTTFKPNPPKVTKQETLLNTLTDEQLTTLLLAASDRRI